MAEIVFENVCKRYADGSLAVRDLNLTIRDGEFLVLVGPSGCGKSTTLNMLAGLESISSGTLRIEGVDVTHTPPQVRDIAMVFQSYALYPHMSVRENIAFPLRVAKLSKAEQKARVERTAEILHLTELLERKPGQLSGGQRQRVAMGRAMVRSPKAFLMDEPLSNLDAKLRLKMRMQIAQMQQKLGTTTVYVTHDQTEAMTLGQRVVVMRKGVVQQVDAPRVLYERPKNLFVAGFMGSPGMNFLPAHIEGAELRCTLGRVALAPEQASALAKTSAPDVVLGVRPEGLQLAQEGEAAPERALCFQRRIEATELVGADVYAHLSLDGAWRDTAAHPDLDVSDTLLVRFAADAAREAGELVSLRVDVAKLAVFDAQTGESLLA